jgi:PhzF family phenazine biosynthesis protein
VIYPRFQLVDVFSDQPFRGNPLGVVLDADGLPGERMLEITRWLNLSETAFLLPPADPGADYRVRIFTLDRELPFAGHPTLGSCHAWLEGGGRPRDPRTIVQECGAGLVRVRRDGGTLAFAAPPLLRSGPVAEAELADIAGFLGIPRRDIVAAEWADNGPGWMIVLLPSAQAVLDLEPARSHPATLTVGVVGPCPAGSEAAFELRAFFSDQRGTVLEDPVTGSLNAAAAQLLLGSGLASAPYTASQGSRLGRRGRIFIDQDGAGTVWIGGHARTLFEGRATGW